MKRVITSLLLILLSCSLSLATSITLPQTGQTSCYDASGNLINCQNTLQDGALKAGAAWPNPRFVDNNNGTVGDKLTNLIWTKIADAPEAGSCGKPLAMDWQEASDYISCLNNLNNGSGYLNAHWALPNLNQLSSLINLQEAQNTQYLMSGGFENVQAANYWTNDTYVGDPGKAWAVSIDGAGQTQDDKLLIKNHVWPVRIGPDLVVTGVSPAQTSVSTGQFVYISAKVKNEGVEPVEEAFYTGFYLSTDDVLSADDTWVGHVYYNGLVGGAQGEFGTTIRIPNGKPSGRYYFLAKADYGGSVNDELNEDNNILACPVAVTYAPPDLVVKAVTPAQTSVSTGQRVYISAKVKNEGVEPVEEAFYTGFYLSTDDVLSADDTWVGHVYYNGLEGGAQGEFGTEIRIPNGKPSGQYFFLAKADYGGSVNDELNEDNNVLFSSPVIVTYAPPDLVVKAVTPAQTSVSAGQWVYVSAKVKNEGVEPVEEAFYTGFYLSTDTVLSADDTWVGHVYYNGLEGGAQGEFGTNIRIPNGMASGQYYFMAKADYTNIVNDELDEGNNTLTSVPIEIQ